MKILVVGSGGREHALAWRLSHEADVIVTPGNPGIAEDVRCAAVPATDFSGIVALARAEAVDLVVIGPEDPLILGLGDQLRAANIPVFGPGKASARLEASKVFAKAVMSQAGVPTAAYRTFEHPETAIAYARERFADGYPCVVKASGQALGKGVIMCDSAEDAEAAIRAMLVERVFGDSGAEIVIEDRLEGPEFSVFSIVGEQNFVTLPIAQDYKRVGDGDHGPNTGGMGSYSPVPGIPERLVAEVEQTIIRPTLDAMRADGKPFTGTLFTGVMMHRGRPHCLEFNVRFGDPETQSLMMRLGDGFAAALWQSATGDIVEVPQIRPEAAVSVVIASAGYPGPISRGLPIAIDPLPEGVKVFHAGTARKNDHVVTNGGRVLCLSAIAAGIPEARELAYRATHAVRFEGAIFRRDIAAGVSA
ncbi:MAG: phosphoribosylamine--glycine ligase [Fimbriimonadaceae bacterium]|nr:phosphoribosylamine--glycine ligase [Fimbriimonadaceae bacterium]